MYFGDIYGVSTINLVLQESVCNRSNKEAKIGGVISAQAGEEQGAGR